MIADGRGSEEMKKLKKVAVLAPRRLSEATKLKLVRCPHGVAFFLD